MERMAQRALREHNIFNYYTLVQNREPYVFDGFSFDGNGCLTLSLFLVPIPQFVFYACITLFILKPTVFVAAAQFKYKVNSRDTDRYIYYIGKAARCKGK